MTAIAISLGTLNPKSWREVALVADEVGIDAVFVSDHVVAPAAVTGALGLGDEAERMRPQTPLFDALGYLSYLAGITERVQLGTCVYLLGLRHPFVAARGVATLDVVSGGRVLFGVGAGWLTSEWVAAGVPPKRRGARLDECIDVCRRLWTEELVEHHGEFYVFAAVGFAPKPVRPGGVPLLVGGESQAALRRAAVRGDGRLGMYQTPRQAAERIAALRTLRTEAGREGPFGITVGGEVRSAEDLAGWQSLGVDRVVVRPWTSSRTAAAELREFAARMLPPRA
ncbi:TIGR03619 family F420-dependent LLM class oxidoreductase [Streptomyces sp. UG1]|uniref:TIGR03619 family F420-dependent LLM class oxidoreductase n=1 Tax=Streptomyces sp. UG1 TaxID=3417652 RepID=UPI003CEE1022